MPPLCRTCVCVMAAPPQSAHDPLVHCTELTTPPASLEVKVAKNSVFVSCANLVMSILGPGQLTLPYCLHQLGLISGVVLIAVFALMSVHSMAALSSCSKQVAATSYKETIECILGGRAKVVLDVIILLYIWGGNVAYFVIVKTQLGILAKAVNLDVPATVLLAIVVAGFVFPLTLVRTIKFTSILGVCASMWIIVVVAICAPWVNGGIDACSAAAPQDPPLAVEPWPASFLNIASAVPLVAFAFNGNWAYLSVYSNLESQSPAHTSMLILGTIGTLCCGYAAISLCGYLSYCGDTSSNILDSLEHQQGWRGTLVTVARAALVLQLCLQMPIRFNVASSIAMPPPHNISWREHAGLTAALLVTSAGLAELPVKMHVALGITSAVCASSMLFVFPALCEMRLMAGSLTNAMAVSRVCFAVFVGCVGVFTLVSGTYANLIQI